jgi:hypothetical protein
MRTGFFAFAVLFALSLSSFVVYKNYAPPIEKAVYKNYLAEYKKLELPLKLETFINESYTKPISTNYCHFIPFICERMMMRMPIHEAVGEYYPVGIIAANKKYNAVIYVEKTATTEFNPDINKTENAKSSYKFYLQTIDKNGDVISDQMIFALVDGGTNTATISKDLAVSTTIGDKKTNYTVSSKGKIVAN